MREMTQYEIGPIAKVNADDLVQTLKQASVPFSEGGEDRVTILAIGPEAEYELRTVLDRRGKPKKAYILIRYENPVLKGIIQDWAHSCGAQIADEFFVSHFTLSPALLNTVRALWRVDLSSLPATPVRVVPACMVFMFGRNVAAEIAAQLAPVQGRPMGKTEFIRGPEFGVAGDEPFDICAYGWRSRPDSQLFVITASAPAMTLLSLWKVSADGAIEHNIEEEPNQTPEDTVLKLADPQR